MNNLYGHDPKSNWEHIKESLQGAVYLGGILLLFLIGVLFGAASCDPRNPTPMDTGYSRTK